jgi:hypothetical protein
MLGTFEILRAVKKFQAVSYALILIVVILFLPGGLMNLRKILFPSRQPAKEGEGEDVGNSDDKRRDS